MAHGSRRGAGAAPCLGGDADVLDAGWPIFEIELGKNYRFRGAEPNPLVVSMQPSRR
ncbi:hypothetical protein F01_460351 [Burkholderia cenocepacia]|nr:hypothetical protein F01_460351 [Burkholderia cenocepacia]